MVIAPEHPLVDVITTPARKAAVKEYCAAAARKSDLDRTDLAKEKTGVFTGAYAINPVNHEKIPIWISDYVLISYGTGAIMAVPAHDDRDYEFAKKFELPIIPVVEPPDPNEAELVRRGELCFTGNGRAINSGPFNGLPTPEFKERITAWLAERGQGKKAVNYKLRDWLFSRQRYWGEPFPILHTEDGRIIGLSEEELPLRLPDVVDYRPPGTGESPLAKATEWLHVTRPDGTKATRETNTMPQWAGSCWYYLRYLDPRNSQRGWDPAKEKYWMPVDLYIGGAEHAVLHLLYARFWHKFLYDLGFVSTKEPFQKLINQGMILGEDGQKMSKSRGNVVNPDRVIEDYGADSMRLYEMFMGPLEAIKPWSMQGVQGVYRFLQKTWRLVVDEETGERAAAIQDAEPDEETVRLLHQTIRKVGTDIETFGFNTAISAMMIFVNHLARQEVRPRSVVESFVLLLAPFAPHIAEELWQRLDHGESLAWERWPQYDAELAKEKQVELPVQVNGKVRDRIVVPADLDEEQIKAKALANEKVIGFLAGKPPKKVIVVKGKLVSIVT
jgi:leucyl-tRNA synthetase